MAPSIHMQWGMGAAYRPGAPRNGACIQQLIDHSGLGLAGCMPQPPDPVAVEKLDDGHLPGHV